MVAPVNVILEGIVGSTAYGLATPESDIDTLGVYQAPTIDLLGLSAPKESIVTTSPDRTLHELGKFVRLCLANNPTVMELLWLDEYRILTPSGRLLIDVRHAFLSATKIRNAYGGYARQQYERLLRRDDGSFSSDLRKRTEKHARHCMRLILQGTHLLAEGELRVRLTSEEVQMCREAGLSAASDLVEFGKMVDVAMAEFDAIPTDLPDEPDVDHIGRLLVELRVRDLSARGDMVSP